MTTHPEMTKQILEQAQKTLVGSANVGTKSTNPSRRIENAPLIRHTHNAMTDRALLDLFLCAMRALVGLAFGYTLRLK